MSDTIKKVNKKERYMEIRAIIDASANEEHKGELLDFIDKRIEEIDHKKKKAKERSEEKKKNGDELRSIVREALTFEYQNADKILSKIDSENVTRAKVIARITQLVKAGIAEKIITKDGTRKVTCYRLVQIDTE